MLLVHRCYTFFLFMQLFIGYRIHTVYACINLCIGPQMLRHRHPRKIRWCYLITHNVGSFAQDWDLCVFFASRALYMVWCMSDYTSREHLTWYSYAQSNWYFLYREWQEVIFVLKAWSNCCLCKRTVCDILNCIWWAPCWPNEPCYQGWCSTFETDAFPVYVAWF